MPIELQTKVSLLPRTKASLEHILRREGPTVVDEFIKRLNTSDDPNKENLSILQKKARDNDPQKRIRILRENAYRDSFGRPTNS